jgi:hypothetical protein
MRRGLRARGAHALVSPTQSCRKRALFRGRAARSGCGVGTRPAEALPWSGRGEVRRGVTTGRGAGQIVI